MRYSRTLLSALLFAGILIAPPALAIPVSYGITLIDAHDGETFASGGFNVDDAGFTPGALLLLDDFSLVFVEEGDPPMVQSIDSCPGTPQGQVDPAGTDVGAATASCIVTIVGVEEVPVAFDFNLDGSFSWVVIPGVVFINGTYEVERVGSVPEPGTTTLIDLGPLLMALPAHRSLRAGFYSRCTG